MQQFDVTAIGEVLVDFTPQKGVPHGYTANPGGAPANLLAQLARLSHKTAFMGMVGHDAFGDFLQQTLVGEGIDVSGLKRHEAIPTTLAFVHIAPGGERSFTFYRHPGADILFAPEDIDTALIDAARVLHFGGVSLSDEPMRSATLCAAQYARRAGKLVTFDPNYRAALWGTAAQATEWMRKGIGLCDVLKISDEEALMATGEADVERAAGALLRMGPCLVLVTLGARGCLCAHANLVRRFATYDTDVVDTTGAGDSFFGAVLACLLKTRVHPAQLDAAQLAHMVAFGNAAGATCAAGYGAIPALPGVTEIEHCMRACAPLD